MWHIVYYVSVHYAPLKLLVKTVFSQIRNENRKTNYTIKRTR
jgi:hypothetical protein